MTWIWTLHRAHNKLKNPIEEDKIWATALQACRASHLGCKKRRCDKYSNMQIPEFHLHKIMNHPALGNTKYKFCTYIPKKAKEEQEQCRNIDMVFLPEEENVTSFSMPRRIVSRKEPPQHVEQHTVVWVPC